MIVRSIQGYFVCFTLSCETLNLRLEACVFSMENALRLCQKEGAAVCLVCCHHILLELGRTAASFTRQTQGAEDSVHWRAIHVTASSQKFLEQIAGYGSNMMSVFVS